MQRASSGGISPNSKISASQQILVSRISMGPKTRSPAFQRVTSAPVSSTTPTPEVPVLKGSPSRGPQPQERSS